MRFYINFSDSVKFAKAAENIVGHSRFMANHSFFNLKQLENHTGQSFTISFKPLVDQVLSVVFRLFPTADASIVIAGITHGFPIADVNNSGLLHKVREHCSQLFSLNLIVKFRKGGN